MMAILQDLNGGLDLKTLVRLAQVFAMAEQETEAEREEERSDLFQTILSTAVFEYRDGWTAEKLRKVLLRYWTTELELIEKAVKLVIG